MDIINYDIDQEYYGSRIINTIKKIDVYFFFPLWIFVGESIELIT